MTTLLDAARGRLEEIDDETLEAGIQRVENGATYAMAKTGPERTQHWIQLAALEATTGRHSKSVRYGLGLLGVAVTERMVAAAEGYLERRAGERTAKAQAEKAKARAEQIAQEEQALRRARNAPATPRQIAYLRVLVDEPGAIAVEFNPATITKRAASRLIEILKQNAA